MTLHELARWVRSHSGILVELAGDSLSVGVPWVHVETRVEGIDWFTVRTLAQARALLGY